MVLDPKDPKIVKSIDIKEDKEIGEVVVTISLWQVYRDSIRTSITTEDVIPVVESSGINILSTIKRDNISNRNGDVTGTWIFKIPTIEPENSTTTILKRRENKKKREKVVEEDWNLGPEE